uniref:Uncharacterized protein n=1 Tax=Chromera velia CCMP2878 TaxID=1169474 RepID=A0A0G4FSI0_9ALVE|eukprot:Cvel_18547.t1-p1 / transcript=Cvel_18547.t1 / gene=Cvel_18547 / organism=Chromera_velia_CCMP2878 / gene_product=hypothetical protein / transcript_product=hypothetical protein / location=Cvel_scaffold1544:25165-27102(+) / protein_length=646 / sequence_SO=supercontig / SO=protein_coding / is_pseudo=false
MPERLRGGKYAPMFVEVPNGKPYWKPTSKVRSSEDLYGSESPSGGYSPSFALRTAAYHSMGSDLLYTPTMCRTPTRSPKAERKPYRQAPLRPLRPQSVQPIQRSASPQRQQNQYASTHYTPDPRTYTPIYTPPDVLTYTQPSAPVYTYPSSPVPARSVPPLLSLHPPHYAHTAPRYLHSPSQWSTERVARNMDGQPHVGTFFNSPHPMRTSPLPPPFTPYPLPPSPVTHTCGVIPEQRLEYENEPVMGIWQTPPGSPPPMHATAQPSVLPPSTFQPGAQRNGRSQSTYADRAPFQAPPKAPSRQSTRITSSRFQVPGHAEAVEKLTRELRQQQPTTSHSSHWSSDKQPPVTYMQLHAHTNTGKGRRTTDRPCSAPVRAPLQPSTTISDQPSSSTQQLLHSRTPPPMERRATEEVVCSLETAAEKGEGSLASLPWATRLGESTARTGGGRFSFSLPDDEGGEGVWIFPAGTAAEATVTATTEDCISIPLRPWVSGQSKKSSLTSAAARGIRENCTDRQGSREYLRIHETRKRLNREMLQRRKPGPSGKLRAATVTDVVEIKELGVDSGTQQNAAETQEETAPCEGGQTGEPRAAFEAADSEAAAQMEPLSGPSTVYYAAREGGRLVCKGLYVGYCVPPTEEGEVEET